MLHDVIREFSVRVLSPQTRGKSRLDPDWRFCDYPSCGERSRKTIHHHRSGKAFIHVSHIDRSGLTLPIGIASDTIQRETAGGKVFAQYLHNVNSRVKVFAPDGAAEGELPLPGIGTAGPPSGLWESPEVLYSFTSFTTPTVIYRHDVKAGKSGDADTRVAPLHARKMAALLQSATSSVRPVLIHYETTTGHSGGEPLSKQIEDMARETAFLWWQLGMQ